MYQLPSPLFSWAWSAQFLSLATESESGLILLGQQQKEPAYCHFSRLSAEGEEESWLWLFPDTRQAASLRLMQRINIDDRLRDLVELTIPMSLPDCTYPTYLQVVDLDHLRRAPLEESGIVEVWIGFDYRKYASDRRMRAAVDTVLPTSEFVRKAALT